MNKAFDNLEVWWVTGAQLLYGGDAVVAVDGHSKEMVDGLNTSGNIPVKIVYKGTANSSKEVEQIMLAANNDEKCVGIITWMHTFSPAKMWTEEEVLQRCIRALADSFALVSVPRSFLFVSRYKGASVEDKKRQQAFLAPLPGTAVVNLRARLSSYLSFSFFFYLHPCYPF